MQAPLRLYFLPNCPHCIQMIQRISTSPVPVQLIDATGDSVITNGMIQMFGRFEVPLLLDMAHGQGIRGYQEAEIDKLLSSFVPGPPPTDGAGTPAPSEHPADQSASPAPSSAASAS